MCVCSVFGAECDVAINSEKIGNVCNVTCLLHEQGDSTIIRKTEEKGGENTLLYIFRLTVVFDCKDGIIKLCQVLFF